MSDPFHKTRSDTQGLYEEYYLTDERDVVLVKRFQQAIGAATIHAKPMGVQEVQNFMGAADAGNIKDKYEEAWTKKNAPR